VLALASILAAAVTAGARPQTPEKPAKPAPPAAGQQEGAAAGSKQGGADAAFMRQAAMDGMAEVDHGRLATQNASSADVKQFAQRMVDDHSKANDELKAIASAKKVTLPTTLDAKHQAMHDKLAKMKGAEFDKAYMTHIVSAHKQAVTLFAQEAKSGKDPEARAFAEKTLPTLREHLKLATDTAAKTGKGAVK
jgi:putative membrane protein